MNHILSIFYCNLKKEKKVTQHFPIALYLVSYTDLSSSSSRLERLEAKSSFFILIIKYTIAQLIMFY